MSNMSLYLRPAIGCSLAGIFAWMAWIDLDGIARGAVIGAALVSAVLFVLTAQREWQIEQAVANLHAEPPMAPIAGDDGPFDDEPVFGSFPPRVFGDDDEVWP